MYGAFTGQTGTGDDAGAFSDLLNGVKLNFAGAHDTVQIGAFDANTNIAYGRAIFNPLGLTSAGQVLAAAHHHRLRHRHTQLARPANRARSIAQQQLTRNVDYTIDYPSGMLRFINVPLPYDANFNPQVVLVHVRIRRHRKRCDHGRRARC